MPIRSKRRITTRSMRAQEAKRRDEIALKAAEDKIARLKEFEYLARDQLNIVLIVRENGQLFRSISDCILPLRESRLIKWLFLRNEGYLLSRCRLRRLKRGLKQLRLKEKRELPMLR